MGGAGRRRASGGRRLPRLLVGLAAALLLLEGGLRLGMGNYAQSRLLRRAEDPAVCLELRPGSDLTYTGWLRRVPPTRMQVHALGGRGPEPPTAEPPPGRLRVLAVGDSFTFGQGVELEQALPARTEEALAAAGLPAEVLNFGVPGHAAPQAVAHAERLLALSPDLVLLHVFPNDLSPGESRCSRGSGGSALSRGLLQHVYAARLAYLLAAPLRGAGTGSDPAELGAEPEAEARRRFQEALGRLHALGEERGFLTAAVLLTDRLAYVREPWCRGCLPAHDLAPATGIRVVDLGGTWKAVRDYPETYLIAGEGHLTAAGNRLLADALASELASWPELRARAGK